MRVIHRFVLSLFAFLTFSANATDTYNQLNNQLSIPAVILGDTVYRDVVITVGEVLIVGGTSSDPKYLAKPDSSFDTYDPATNRLTIPNVKAFGIVYHDVVITVDKVIAVGEALPITNDVPLSIQETLFNSEILSELSLDNIFNDDLLHDVLALGDVNGDGYDDILIGLMRLEKGTYNSVKRNVKPVLLTFNPIKNIYEVNEVFKNITSKHIWPRQAAIADFDGDGRNDIFIADHGVDGGAYNCGYKNSLILNKSSGMVNASHLLPKYDDYSHGLIVADFDKDGKSDALVLNSPYILKDICKVPGIDYANKSYFFTGGNFVETPLALKYNDFDQFNQPVINFSNNDKGERFVGGTSDLNKDGFPDIVTGNNGSITILESDGILSFGKSQTILAPAKYVKMINDNGKCFIINATCSIPYSYISFFDIDGDGHDEIIASLLNQRSDIGWVGQYFQALKKINGNWTDITDIVFPQQSSIQSGGGEWCYRVQFFDFNGDGKKDILCSFYNSSIWEFNNGSFYKSRNTNSRQIVVKFPNANYLMTFNHTPRTITITGSKI
jgi:hypothetical protein